MHANSLAQALEFQNAVDFGLTAGLHTQHPDDLALWLDRVQAGNLYVNRGITGAIVQRQPFGGWKRSSVGGGAKAGGRSEEHTSELQSLMRISYAVFCLKNKNNKQH